VESVAKTSAIVSPVASLCKEGQKNSRTSEMERGFTHGYLSMNAAAHTTLVNAQDHELAVNDSTSPAFDPSHIPLSFAQQRLWFLDQLEPNTSLYNIPTVVRISGSLDVKNLERAFNALIARHEILRTRIVCEQDIPVQNISDRETIDLRCVERTTVRDNEEHIQRLVREEINRPFNLATDLLVRALLIKISTHEHLLVVTLHHIISDEWSLRIFFEELGEFYGAFVEGKEQTLPELQIQYADYSIWQREWLQGEVLESQLRYWKDKLKDSPPPLKLPGDCARVSNPTRRGGNLERAFPNALGESLRKMATREGATLFMVLLAGFKALLHRYTAQEDIIVASPIAGRNRVETEGLIGLFVNTLALRTSVTGEMTFRELLTQVQKTTLGAYAHQDLPFEKLVEALHPERSSHQLHFTNVMFVLQQGIRDTRFSGLTLTFPDVVSEMSKFELTLAVQESLRGLVARVEYDADLFEESTVERLLGHFENVLQAMAGDPQQTIRAAPLLSKAEFERAIVEWNHTASAYPRNCSVPEIFEKQAASTPKAPAVRYGHQVLSYGELNARANQVAHLLKRYGVGPEVPVAICTHRSIEMVIGLLGILKAGGAYVPLNGNYPAERLEFMLADSEATVLLTEQPLLSRFLRESRKTICLDADCELITREPRNNLPSESKADSLAYIMYTSGSTGRPKGVAVTHRAINRLVLNSNFLQLSKAERVAQVSNLSFDAATFEIWGALLNGGQLVVINTDITLSPQDFADELREQRVSAMFLTAALFNQLAAAVPGAFSTVRTLIAGGEALDPKWTRSVLRQGPPARLLNGYGPTENTTFSCCHLIANVAEDALTIPIGRPISNSTAYVLDQYMNPVPIGVTGILYVGGDGLARGYWNQPELTSERFVPNPFGAGTIYNTGDLARYLPDGNIEFLGRKDGQIKIRGFRIELGEIESVLSRHNEVRECCVASMLDETGEKRLVAYFVAARDKAPTISLLRQFLTAKLPQFMVPAAFVELDQLPLTPNGKVDRKALPAPNQTRPELEKEYTSPRDDIERELTKIWEEVLEVRPIGIEDKFFDLGGHSLLAVRLVAQIGKVFGKKIRLAAVFHAPTVAQMAAVLREDSKANETTMHSSSIVEIQSKGTRPPLFLVHGAGGGMFWGYVNLARHFRNDQPVYGFRSRGLDGKTEFESLEEMAGQYVNDLRLMQPHGPYYLGGYCFGGNVAYEMACQLAASGEKIGLLALINCAPPNSGYGRLQYNPAWFWRFLRNLVYWAGYCAQWTPSQRRDFFRWKMKMARKNLRALLRIPNKTCTRLDVENMVDLSSFTPEQQELWETHIRGQLNYKPKPFEGRVHLFRSLGHPVWCSFDPQYGWGELARGGVEVTMVPAGHEKILEEPFVKVVAEGIEKILEAEDLSTHSPMPALQTSGIEPAKGSNEDQRKQAESDTWAEQLTFLKNQMAGVPDLLEFPADHPRPAKQSYRALTEKLHVPDELIPRVGAVLEQLGADAQDFFGASVAVLLKRYIRQEQCVIATVVEDRSEPQLKRLIGHLEHLVLLPTDLSGDPAFIDLLRQLQRTKSSVVAQQTVPFEKVLEHLQPSRDQSYHPLAQLLFSYSTGECLSMETAGLQISEVLLEPNTTKFDLHLQVIRQPQGLTLQVKYAADLFSPESMGRLLQHWQNLIEGLSTNPEQKVSRLRMLTPSEEHTLLNEWTNTRQDYPREKTLVELFAEQASRRPDAIALVAGGTRLTYRELHERASAVSNNLRAVGVGKEELVGVCLERSWEMVAGILGALQAGAAYVPMDPAYPRERLEFMAQDARMPVILTQNKLLESLPKVGSRIICVEDIEWETSSEKFDPVRDLHSNPSRAQATNLAYVIYTSGSTGKPKGVALEHRNAVAFVYWAKDVFTSEELDGVLASTSICFDLSIFELFVPLCWGGKVILVENALALPSVPAANEVRLINTVPSAIRELLRAKGVPESVRVVNLAGEPLPTALVEKIYAESSVKKVYDLYGPTETTTYSTFTLRQPKMPAIIGRPLTNEQVYILDNQRQLVPTGVPGELFIGGDGLARGYLDRPELTAERFVPHPFIPEARLYRTGDLAKWRQDGNLEFLGRIDHQVKIRGFRIELGEVESAVKKISRVSDAVVMAWEDSSGNKRLVAYVVLERKGEHAVAKDSVESTSEHLRRSLRTHLPEYMVPSVFVFLDAIPLTPNGKVDRKALPAPEIPRATNGEVQEPRTALEQQISNIWSEVLQIQNVGLTENFFDLGGHSLLAFQVISRLRTVFRIEVPFSGLFETPTVSTLAKAITEGRWGMHQVSDSGPKPIKREGKVSVSFVQERLWFLDQLNPASPAYNVPMALRLKGQIKVANLQEALDRVIERHEALRTRFTYAEEAVSQVIEPSIPVKIRLIEPNEDLRNEKPLQHVLNTEARIPFNLALGPLIRAVLVRIDEADHALLVVMHHTISDGWSLALFFRELQAFYEAALLGSRPELSELSLQYGDFAHWQREVMSGQVLEQELDYWKRTLQGVPARVELPSKSSESSSAGGKAGRRALILSAEATAAIANSGHSGITPFMVLLAAIAVTLRKWCSQNDIVIGTVVAGRTYEAIENVIGCFMNFLPIRTRLNGTETGREVLEKVKETVLEAQSHQDCPFEKIVEALNPERRSNQNPLYNVGLLVQNFPAQIFRTDSIESSPIAIDLEAALLDLRFEAEQTPQGYSLCCEYKTELFEGKIIEELLASVSRTIEGLTFAPETKITELKLTDALEAQVGGDSVRRAKQVVAVAATFTAEPIEESIRYWTKALNFPAEVAFAPYNQVFQQLLDPASLLLGNRHGLNVLLLRLEDWQKTFAELERPDIDNVQRSANELVRALQSASTSRSVPWLVCFCPPSNRMPSNTFQKLTTAERTLTAELQKLSGVYVVTLDELRKWYPIAEYYDSHGDELGHVPYTPAMFTALGTMIARKLHALNRPSYKVIALDCDQTLWTGVCGEDGPEGIRLEPPRVALQNFMRAQKDAGMLLCLCSKNNQEDVEQVFRHNKEMPLKREDFVASRLNWRSKPENLKSLADELKVGLDSFIFVDDNPVECAAVQDQCRGVQTLLLPENAELIPQFLNHCWVFDHLKATSEDRSRTEMYQQNRDRQRFREQSMSLGDFINGLALDIQIRPIKSEDLSRVAQLTQRTNQFNFTTRRRTEHELQALSATSEILTVTVSDRFGDYGLVGVILYKRQIGLIDVDTFLLSCRVLGRGVEHRMLAHLGEIARENRLGWVDLRFTRTEKNKPAYDFIEKVGAPFRQAQNGDYLYRFPAGIAAGIRFEAQALEAASPVSDGHMAKSEKRQQEITHRFNRYREVALQTMEVEAIQQSIEAEKVKRAATQDGYLQPRTDLERQLCELWQKLLHVERVGVQDNFFELGGHSLLAVRLFSEVEKLTQRKLPLVTLFQAPTIEQLAGVLAQNEVHGAHSLVVPIQPQGSKTPLFLVHGAGGDVLWGYANLAARLSNDQPVYGIKSRGQAGLEEWKTLEEMAAGYLQEVRALQPVGPYCLGGYCFGGNVAYEMARQLHAQGEPVALLALLDSAPANAGYETVTWWRPSYAFHFVKNLFYWCSDFSQLDSKTKFRFIARKTRALGRKLAEALRGRNGTEKVDIEDVIDPALFPENELNLWKIHLQALTEHVQQPYAGRAMLFRTRGHPIFCSLAEDFCWGKLLERGVDVRSVPGSHESIFVEPNVQCLAKELETALGKAATPGVTTKSDTARVDVVHS
jgi:amino acid adenylation domain-containing protein/FkbH-like protein